MGNSIEPIIVHKNRKRAVWSLVIIAFFVPISAWLVLLGVQPGRPDVSWMMVFFGVAGLVAFTGSGVLVVRTMRAPWRLSLCREHLGVYTPAYDLEIPWADIKQIGVTDVNRREGCVLVFDDVNSVVQQARFHPGARRPDAITNAEVMRARMEENYDRLGYHLAFPGRMLETGPAELAQMLTRGCTGALWQEAGKDA